MYWYCTLALLLYILEIKPGYPGTHVKIFLKLTTTCTCGKALHVVKLYEVHIVAHVWRASYTSKRNIINFIEAGTVFNTSVKKNN